MTEPRSGTSPPARRKRRWGWPSAGQAIVLAILLASATAGAVSLRITSSTETSVGLVSPTDFLAHWQQTGSLAAVTIAPLPPRLSLAVATPTRLPGVAANRGVNFGVAGHLALEWTFQESAGTPVNVEIEIAFTVHYLVGATATTFARTVYVETQAASPTAAITFSIFWDSGHATGVTFVSQVEISQVCSAVGTCP